ncbi:ABC transporter permease [Kineococcus glutinatus]|uniref:Transport permease protein n=1 Tax=Kineococcus glutinatus TaxID=1070872 RepID=A0ABP8VF28_9ACTN
MSAATLAAADSATMLRRYLLRMRRYPSLTVLLVGMPVLLLLLFVHVFGGTLGAGLPGGALPGADGRGRYLDFVTPALVVAAAIGAAQGTAISVAMDRTTGIVARFRTMAISPVSVLAGHVLGSVVQSVLAMGVLLVAAVALGYRPGAGFAGWVALAGFLVLLSLALTWLCLALGLLSDSVETASNLPMPLLLLPFLGSGFVPVESMPAGLRWFAAHQPATPVIETVRGLLDGRADAGTAATAVAWCAVLALAGWAWSLRLFRRTTTG